MNKITIKEYVNINEEVDDLILDRMCENEITEIADAIFLMAQTEDYDIEYKSIVSFVDNKIMGFCEKYDQREYGTGYSLLEECQRAWEFKNGIRQT